MQLWIGPLPAPTRWMATWRTKNPAWEYRLWDNDAIFGRKWRTQHLIDEYVRRYEEEIRGKGEAGTDRFVSARGSVFSGEKATLFAWHVIADLVRYEILYEHGGYMPGADSVCLKPLDLVRPFHGNVDLYTLRTGHLFERQRKALEAKYPDGKPAAEDRLKWDRYDPMNASPVLASTKSNEFLKHCIDELVKLRPEDLGEAVDTTGNVFMGKMLRKYPPKRAKIANYLPRAQRIKRGFHSIHYAGTTKNMYRKGR